MELITSNSIERVFSGKWIFLDNDFLSDIFQGGISGRAFDDLLAVTKEGHLIIDPLTRFEFLSNSHPPRLKELKEAFLDVDHDIFQIAVDRPEFFQKIRSNAVSISSIYALNQIKGPSSVDLLLAARVAFYSPKSLLITSNRKDFPSLIFDTLGVINYEQGNQIKACPVLKFNSQNYNNAVEQWERAKSAGLSQKIKSQQHLES